MRRSLVAVALGLLALVVAPGLASGTHSKGKGPKQDFARGTGHFEGPFPANPALPLNLTMHFSARSGPSGENPRGRFFVHRSEPTPLDIHGEVTCLNVDGDRASIGGRVERTHQPGAAPAGSGILFQVIDNGEGRKGTPDRVQGDLVASPPTVCPSPTATPRLAIQQGNYLVHDGSP